MRIVRNHIGHAEIMGEDDEVVGLSQNHLGHAEIYSGSDMGWNPFKKAWGGIRSAGRVVSRQRGKIAAPLGVLTAIPGSVIDVASGKAPWRKGSFTRKALSDARKRWNRKYR